MSEFKHYHPIVTAVYYVAVIIFSAILLNPVCLIISGVCGFAYSCILGGRRTLKFNLLCILPMFAAAALINPAFNHEGVTIIKYFPNGNPLTLESVVYGIAAAAMIASVIFQFSAFNNIMTSDKIIFLFGRIIPSFSLIVSMTLRFIPRLGRLIRETADGRKCINRGIADGGILKRAKNGIEILSAVITRSLDDSVDTADSMRGRGYGLSGRTSYSDYIFERRDAIALTLILALSAYIICGNVTGGFYFRYFPSIRQTVISAYSISLCAAYLILFALPIIIGVKEELRWKNLKSRS